MMQYLNAMGRLVFLRSWGLIIHEFYEKSVSKIKFKCRSIYEIDLYTSIYDKRNDAIYTLAVLKYEASTL